MRPACVAFLTCLVNVEGSRLRKPSSHDSIDHVGPQTSVDKLVQFIRSHGGKVSPSFSLSTGSLRGIVASSDVAKGETLLALPPNLILTGAQAARQGLGCAVARVIAECDGRNSTCSELLNSTMLYETSYAVGRSLELSVFLLTRLYGRGADAGFLCDPTPMPADFFDAYVSMLPTMSDLQSFPAFAILKKPCQEALNGTIAAQRANDLRAMTTKQWNFLTQHVPALQQYTFDEFFHAKALVITRAFGARLAPDTQASEPVLLPLADMMNMDARRQPTAEDSWEDGHTSAHGFKLTAAQSLNAGSAVLGTYGDRDGLDLYSTYGFFFEMQPLESVRLELRPFAGELPPNSTSRVENILSRVDRHMNWSLRLHQDPRVQLQQALEFARSVVIANTTAAAQNAALPLSLHLERLAVEFLHAHIEAQVQLDRGAAALSSLREPQALSLASASCEVYGHLTLEPYGALLDFTEAAMEYIDQRMGHHTKGKRQVRPEVSPLREEWAFRFFDAWRSSLPPAKSFLKI